MNKLAVILVTVIAAVSLAGCTAAAKAPTTSSRTIPVQRGNLDVTVSVDGKLNMPQAFDLHFGAPGNVLDVNVKEGDIVKAGTVLATLDATTQELAIKTANNAVQTTLANLYETVPRLPKFRTNYYESTSVISPPTPLTTATTSTIYLAGDTIPPAPPASVTTVTGNSPTASSPGSITTTTVTLTAYTITPVQIVVTPGSTTIVTTPGPNTVPTIIPPGTITLDTSTFTVGTLNATIVTKSLSTTQTTTTTSALTAPEGVHNDISYPAYYPTGTILDGYAWYQQELSNSSQLFSSANYTGASAELNVALADLESIIIMIEDAINNPDSGLGNMAPVVNDQNIDYMEAMLQDPSGAGFYIQVLRKDIDQIKQAQADIQKARDLIAQKKYDEAAAQYQVALAGMQPIGTIVYTNYNVIIKKSDTDIYGKDLSIRFFNAAEVKLNEASAGLARDGLKSPDLETNLHIAEHYMMLSNAILGTNDYVLQHGLSLKAQQQYNVDLANKLVTLKDRNDDFLKTVILAPVDGIVVAVNLRGNDVLSSIDYASKGDIMIVDTSQLQFKGQVDEIDISKIKAGQKASITVDAVPNKTFPGKVSFISPYGTPDANGVVRFNVTILLDPTDVPLKGLLTSTAEIAVTSVQNALVLPLTAITTSKDGSFVTVMTSDNKTEKMPVTLGLQNQQSATVLTGLNEGDRVIIQESAAGAPTTRPNFGPGGSGGGGGGPPAGGGGGRPGG